MGDCPFTPSSSHRACSDPSSQFSSVQKNGLPPGPDISPHNLTAEWFSRPYEFMRECAEKFGDIFTLQFAHIGTQVIVSHPDHVKAIFTGDPDQLFAGKGNEILKPIMGKHSPMLLDGDQHLQRRKALLKSFQPGQVWQLADTMDEVTSEYTSSWENGQVIFIQMAMLEISLRIILRAVFGLHDSNVMANLNLSIQRFVTLVGSHSVYSNRNWDTTKNQKVQSLWEKELKTASEQIDSALYAHINHRRTENENKVVATDILGMLLDVNNDEGRPLSNEVLRDHLMTLFIAGHETTASSLAWAMYRLFHTPKSYERLQTELPQTRGCQDPYLEAVCHETLRMNPPISEVSRQLQVPMHLGEYDLPAGIAVSPSIYLAHHRPDTFPSPREFQPERFLTRKYSPYEYAPFGGGVRRCIGMPFSLLEMKVVLSNLLRNFHFENAEVRPTTPMRRAVIVAPSGGGRARIWRRKRQ